MGRFPWGLAVPRDERLILHNAPCFSDQDAYSPFLASVARYTPTFIGTAVAILGCSE